MLKCGKILKEEEELLRLNSEIDSKTKDLLQEVEQLKENQMNMETVYMAWEKAGVEEADSPEKSKTEGSLPDANVGFPEDDFDLASYFSRIRANNTESSSPEGFERLEQKPIREPRQASKSAKVSLSRSTDLALQAVFPVGVAKQKTETKLKSDSFHGSDVIPEVTKGIGREGLTRFLTARVKVLTEQVQALQKEQRKSSDRIKELQSQNDKVFEEKERLIQQVNSAKNVLVKCEQHTNDIVNQLQTTQAENNHLKKELESLRKEMRQSRQTNSANELRLNRTLEEVDKLKVALQQVKQEDKELKEASRRKIDDLTSAVKKLDKQRTELLHGFKKQLVVIDNLKKQKGLLEAARVLKSAEDDFINFLDCNPSNVVNRRRLFKTSRS